MPQYDLRSVGLFVVKNTTKRPTPLRRIRQALCIGGVCLSKYRIGFPKLRWENGIPRILIKESLAKRTKWASRGFAVFCVAISIISFPWYVALIISIACFIINIIIEKVIFYYINEINFSKLTVPYDSSKWVMNSFLWHQPPKSKYQVNDEFSIVFNDVDYAVEFFRLLRNWDSEAGLKVSFLIDEDSYFVYLYPDHDSYVIQEEIHRLEGRMLPEKLTNEPFSELNHITICKSFPVGDFSLGKFIEHHSEDVPFNLNAHYRDGKCEPVLIAQIEAIKVSGFKARIPSELTMSEYEGAHWKFVVRPHRRGLGG